MLLEKRGNIKETWAILNTVLGKQRKSVNYPTHLMQRDIHITSKEDMANRPHDVDFNVFIEHERINRVHVTKFLGIYKY